MVRLDWYKFAHVMRRNRTSHRSPDAGGQTAPDQAALLDALGADSLPEQERRVSETIAELQKLREHLIAQRGSTNGSSSSSTDYAERVSPHMRESLLISTRQSEPPQRLSKADDSARVAIAVLARYRNTRAASVARELARRPSVYTRCDIPAHCRAPRVH